MSANHDLLRNEIAAIEAQLRNQGPRTAVERQIAVIKNTISMRESVSEEPVPSNVSAQFTELQNRLDTLNAVEITYTDPATLVAALV